MFLSILLLLVQDPVLETKKLERREGGAAVLVEFPELVQPGLTEKSVNSSIQQALIQSFGLNKTGSNLEDTISAYLAQQKGTVQLTKKVEILFQKGNVLTLKLEESGSGASRVQFSNIDLSTGKTLALDDVLQKDFEKELKQIALANNANPDALAQLSFSDPFSVEEGGIIFHLDQKGHDSVTLPFSAIESYLKDQFQSLLEQ